MGKVTTGYVITQLNKYIGLGTIFGAQRNLQDLFTHYSNPTSFEIKNAATKQQVEIIKFPFSPNEARCMGIELSMSAENPHIAQELLDSSEVARAVMLGDQNDYTLTKREEMIALAFYDMGFKSGIVTALHEDEIRRKSKNASRNRKNASRKRSIWRPHENIIITAIDEYLNAPNRTMKLDDVVSKIEAASGMGGLDTSTVSRWKKQLLDRRENGLSGLFPPAD